MLWPPAIPGGAVRPDHCTPNTAVGKTPPYGQRGITKGFTVPERGVPGIGTGRAGETPGVNAAGMGQDTGTMHCFPIPVLTELTYKNKHKKAQLLRLYPPS